MKTLKEIREIADIDARIIHAAGLLDFTLQKQDADFVASRSRPPMLGELVQRQESRVGSEVVRRINFATGIRNRIAHPSGDGPDHEQKERAANILIESLQKYFLPQQPKQKPVKKLSPGMRKLTRAFHIKRAGLKYSDVGAGGYVEDSISFASYLNEKSDIQLASGELIRHLRTQHPKRLGNINEPDCSRRTSDAHLRKLLVAYLKTYRHSLVNSACGVMKSRLSESSLIERNAISRPEQPAPTSNVSWQTIWLGFACFMILRSIKSFF